MKMKKLITAAFCAVSAVVLAEMPRSEWHALVGDCAQNPTQLKQVIGQLSASDQTAFLAEVNAAITSMPGSGDTKAAAFLAANRAAVTGASKEARLDVLAEVFATVPPEYLTVINESFASDLFNRSASKSRQFTDPEYIELSSNAIVRVSERCKSAENGNVRSTFAALMFVRASGENVPANLVNSLTGAMAGQGDIAKNEWIPAALGMNGVEKSYDPMLGASSAGDEPTLPVLKGISVGDIRESLLADLSGFDSGFDSGTGTASALTDNTNVLIQDPTGIGVNQIPRDAARDPRGYRPDGYESGGGDEPAPAPTPKPPEPTPYYGQHL